MHSPLQSHPQLTMKQLSSLSTLTYSKTPSPQLITQHNMKINLSRFQSINITDKVKEKLHLKAKTQKKRNLSVGSVLLKDSTNPQFLCHTTRDDNFDKVNFLNVNLQQTRKQKGNKFFSKLTGTSRSINSSPKLLDLTLPVIDSKKMKKNSPNRANFMQLWLDEALDPQQLNFDQIKQIQSQLPQDSNKKPLLAQQQQYPNNLSSLGYNHLSTVRQYKIDRQYLRSQNVPKQVIDRLYSTLYIYTYGIEKVFGEILQVMRNQEMQQQQSNISSQTNIKQKHNRKQSKASQCNSVQNNNNTNNNTNNNNNKLLDTFWKSYIKLLQNCTSFQTMFQKVQQQHLLRITQLKQFITKQQQQFQQQRKQLQNKIHKLQKQILLLQNTHNKLLTQHKISQSTLELTDHAFNQQVQFRLKFQQKINHIYSSYQQLKVKYQSTVEVLNLKIQQEMNNKFKQLSQKQHTRRVQSELQQTKHLLQQQQQKVKQRQQQITIKRQQLKDMQQKYHYKLIAETQQQDCINIHVNQFKLLQTKYQQLDKKLSLTQYKYEQSQEKNKQLFHTMEGKRQQCDQLHCKLTIVMKQLAEYQHTKILQQSKINTLQSELNIIKQKHSLIEEQKTSLQTKLHLTSTQLQQKNYQLQTKTQSMEKITITIQDMKASKNKFQRLFKIINEEKLKIQQEKNRILSKYQLQKQEIIGLKMLQQNRQKHIKEIQLRHDKQKDILKRKITGYNEIVTKKESLILQYQKNQEQQMEKILNLNYRLERVEKELNESKNNIVRVEREKDFLQGRLNDAREQIIRLNIQMKQQGQTLREHLKTLDIKQSQLQTIKTLISIIKSQQNFSITNLSVLYNEYKEIINRKGQHIHPMVYEDLTEQYNRVMVEIVPRIKREVEEGIKREQRLNEEMEELRKLIDCRDMEIIKLNQKINQKQEQFKGQQTKSIQLYQQITTLTNTATLLNQQITTQKQTIFSNKQTISLLQQKHKQSSHQLQQINKTLHSKQVQIQKLNANVTILSDKLLLAQNQLNNRLKNNVQLNRVKQLEIENEGLLKELSKYRNKQFVQQQIQTQPQGQVVIERKTLNGNNSSIFLRKNKFTTIPQPKLTDNQTQVTLPPYDNIPLYIDTKISQIRNQSVEKQVIIKYNKSVVMESKQQQSSMLVKQKSMQKMQLGKQQLTRREELRRALRFTYMRR